LRIPVVIDIVVQANFETGGLDMYRKIVSIAVILAFMTVLFGCATVPREHKGAATGAGVGAATGVVAGALLGSPGAKTEMAVLGGVLGALAGGLIGNYAYDKKNSKENTSKKYNYKKSRGVFVKIENASAVPKTVKIGGKIDFRMTYAVLGAPSDGTLSVTETREIKYKGELFAKPKMYVHRGDGTYSSSIPITIPSTAKKGKYTVHFTVSSQNASDSREISFMVK
jgi:uncharacterized protein YcfJ